MARDTATYMDAIGTVAVSLSEWGELTENRREISLLAKMYGRKTRDVALDVLRESNRLDCHDVFPDAGPCCGEYGTGSGNHSDECETGQTDDVEPL